MNDDEEQCKQISRTGIVEKTVAVSQPVPQMRKIITGDTIIKDLVLTSEAVTAQKEASVMEDNQNVLC